MPTSVPATIATAQPSEQSLQDLSVLVLGLGRSGLAMARWCAAAGARVCVVDTRSAPPGLSQLQHSAGFGSDAQSRVRFVVQAKFDAALLTQYAVRWLLLSPGLPPAQTQDIVQAAQALGIACGGELSLWLRAMRALAQEHAYQPKILAITGTNGKTTVTALTHHLLCSVGLRCVMAGNIGPTLLDTLAQHCNALSTTVCEWPQVWVLELSSFQLSSLSAQDGFDPTAATILNLSEDHLDWHSDMADYAAAKARIFGAHTWRVLNRDDSAVYLPPPDHTVRQGRKTKQMPQAYVDFGLGLPLRAHSYGLETQHDVTWLVQAYAGDGDSLMLQRLMPVQALQIKGLHNAGNALAALALARSVGCDFASLLQGLRSYAGEPHRMQWVRTLAGVEYFDDSKGTNVGATLAALRGLGSGAGKVVLLLGGDGKGQNFTPLAGVLSATARACVLYGRDAPIIAQALTASSVPLHHADDLRSATQAAQSLAQPGDAVLLSPACASFDAFCDYVHRAQTYVDAVLALQESGESV